MKIETPYPLKEQIANDELGITLRDHFAGLVLSAMIQDIAIKQVKYISRRAYEIADAMLAERLKINN